MKLYTKTGDNGMTSLYGGQRVSKADIRVDCYGTIDELNSFVGFMLESVTQEYIISFNRKIQNLLFDIGSNVATIEERLIEKLPQLLTSDIEGVESQIDLIQEDLPPMTNFILPGGGEAASRSHLCRTVCRRAERLLVALSQIDNRPSILNSIIFLNRLSDYYFALSRRLSFINQKGEIFWNQNTHL